MENIPAPKRQKQNRQTDLKRDGGPSAMALEIRLLQLNIWFIVTIPVNLLLYSCPILFALPYIKWT